MCDSAHWWEQNDARLSFSGRDPAESHNRTMKTMQETLLGLQHDLGEQARPTFVIMLIHSFFFCNIVCFILLLCSSATFR